MASGDKQGRFPPHKLMSSDKPSAVE